MMMASLELPPAHLDVLINAGIQFGVTDTRRSRIVGEMLRLENLRSVNIRFPGHTAEIAPYTPRIVPIRFRGISVLAVTRTYQHHTRHSLTWRSSPARTWIARLRRVITTGLPEQDKQAIITATGPMMSYKLSPDYITVPDIITSLKQIPTLEPQAVDDSDGDKGLPVDILTGPHDCSNGGLSSRTTHATIISVDGSLPPTARLCAPDDDAPGVYLRFEYGRHVARPLAPTGVHYMASGAYLHTSDARWEQLVGHSLPIPLHDRSER